MNAAVRYALETTRATPECPFHQGVVIRVGDEPPRAMLTNEPKESSGATARYGRKKRSDRSLRVNSVKPQTAAARNARVRGFAEGDFLGVMPYRVGSLQP